MKQRDVAIIGGGFAGLMAAIACAKTGRKASVFFYGSGAFPLNSGLIDILGYDEERTWVADPLAAIEKLPAEHPYHRIGKKSIEEAALFFLDLMKDEGFGYCGSIHEQQAAVTPVGTLKPSCLTPASMQAPDFTGRDVIVVGVKGLKDCCPEMIAANLADTLKEAVNIRTLEITPESAAERDLSILDAARWLEGDGATTVSRQLAAEDGANRVFIFPQILGVRGQRVCKKLQAAMKGKILETTAMPPSANGMRLRDVLMKAARRMGVEFFENARVTGFSADGKRCLSIRVTGVHEKDYRAEKFILATGGFYSGGLIAQDPGAAYEPIFDLPVVCERDPEKWTAADVFDAQPFMKAGVRTDEMLRPVDENGALVFENVHVIGRELAGYDFCREHSGNGVALASAYKAAMA